MRLPNYFLVLLLALISAGTLLAQTVRWSPSSGQLGFNQVSELDLVFEDCEPEEKIALPTITGLQVGNNPSRRTDVQMENFTKVRKTFTLTFPVRPSKRATITIPAFEIKTDKGAITVPAANFTVGDTPVGNSGLAIDDIATATLDTPKPSFWAGEVIPVKYTLNVLKRYYHSLATNIAWSPTPFVAEDWSIPAPAELLVRGERRVVSEQTARVFTKQPGNYTLGPASQMVNLMVGSSGFGFFAAPSVEQRQLDAKPLALTIKPLPPAPADFSGAVGEFTFVSKVIPTTAAIGEPITWTLELNGTGNWPDLTGLPQREASNDFQVVQPKSKRTMKDGSLFDGTLSEDVVLVPTRAGSYQLAPVRFTYFDPKAGTYKTITSTAVTVTVTAPAPAAQPAPGSTAPLQFSLPATEATAPTARPELPTAIPPKPPENLPRDPITTPAHGVVPLTVRTLALIGAALATLIPVGLWLVLAALRSQARDPQRERRHALAQLKATLAALRAATTSPAPLRAPLLDWQHHTTTLWSLPHAAPAATLLEKRLASENPTQAATWAQLWSEADRALHGREAALPADWITRAESAASAVRVPGWAAFSLLAPRHLFPFLFALAVALWPLSAQADAGLEAYQKANYALATTEWQKVVAATPHDWTARHNLGLALAQQDRWTEASAHWSSAFLLNTRSDTTRWELALGLQRAGLAPPTLSELARGEDLFQLVRLATPGEWQLLLLGAALLFGLSLVGLLLRGYNRVGGWIFPTSLTTALIAVVLAVGATFSLHTYGPLADPGAVFVWQNTKLRSIPTDVDTTQQTSAVAAGSIAVAGKTFLGWTQLHFAGGQTGWVRTEELVKLYR